MTVLLVGRVEYIYMLVLIALFLKKTRQKHVCSQLRLPESRSHSSYCGQPLGAYPIGIFKNPGPSTMKHGYAP